MATPLSIYRRLPLLAHPLRRAAVVAAFGGLLLLVLGCLVLVEPGRLSTTAWAAIGAGVGALTLVSHIAIYGYGQGRMGYPTHPLDERQRLTRDRALVLSYRVSSIAVGLVLGALLGAALQGPLVIPSTTLAPVLVAAVLSLPLLPFAALAWIEPDLPTDVEA